MLAVSGGPDSTALLHLAATWRPAQLPLWVATVDHGLRPGARHDAEAVLTTAKALALPGRLLAWEGPKPTHGLQKHARTARYGLLFGFAREVGASHIVTAHTMDDQAETLLIRLAAGSGLRGLAGMRRVTQRNGHHLARPFLGIRKEVLVSLCVAQGWTFVDDPANRDPRFARARWRDMAPALRAEGLTAERLALLSDRVARAETALQSIADRTATSTTLSLDPGRQSFAADLLLAEPDEIVLRVLGTALQMIAPAQTPRLAAQERLQCDLATAHAAGRALRRNLQGCAVTLSGKLLIVEPETPRRPQ